MAIWDTEALKGRLGSCKGVWADTRQVWPLSALKGLVCGTSRAGERETLRQTAPEASLRVQGPNYKAST